MEAGYYNFSSRGRAAGISGIRETGPAAIGKNSLVKYTKNSFIAARAAHTKGQGFMGNLLTIA